MNMQINDLTPYLKKQHKHLSAAQQYKLHWPWPGPPTECRRDLWQGDWLSVYTWYQCRDNFMSAR